MLSGLFDSSPTEIWKDSYAQSDINAVCQSFSTSGGLGMTGWIWGSEVRTSELNRSAPAELSGFHVSF